MGLSGFVRMFIVSIGAAVSASCSNDGRTEGRQVTDYQEYEVTVASKKAPGVYTSCGNNILTDVYAVRYTGEDEWKILASIEGFEYESGYYYGINIFRKKSSFLRRKQDFCIFVFRYVMTMVISKQIQDTLNSIPPGKVFTIADFNVVPKYQPALVKALGRQIAAGNISKISKGKYFKPKQTVFGSLKPPVTEAVKDLLEKNGKPIGYITGIPAFDQMGLTTQITSAITIGTNKYRRPLKRGEYTISFIVQSNAITEENIPLLRILDAIKLIRNIPAATPDDCIINISNLIGNLSDKSREQLCTLAENYTPYVRALLGAILENIGSDTFGLGKTLNGVTTYKLPVSKQALPTKSSWNIVAI